MNRKPLYVVYVDWACFFMSIVKEIQFEVEWRLEVPINVSQVIAELHREVTGEYETAHGMSDPFRIDTGTGQGCVNGASRAKIFLAVVQRMVGRTGAGYTITQGGEGANGVRVPQVVYADDMGLMTESLAGAQMVLDASAMVAILCGMNIKVK